MANDKKKYVEGRLKKALGWFRGKATIEEDDADWLRDTFRPWWRYQLIVKDKDPEVIWRARKAFLKRNTRSMAHFALAYAAANDREDRPNRKDLEAALVAVHGNACKGFTGASIKLFGRWCSG